MRPREAGVRPDRRLRLSTLRQDARRKARVHVWPVHEVAAARMPQQHRGRRATHPIHAGNPAGAGEQIGGREAVPPYGEPRVLPTAALEADLQRRLAAELEPPANRGRSPPQSNLRGAAVTITANPTRFRSRGELPRRCSGGCCRPARASMAWRRTGKRPTGTVPEGLAPSRA